jgi:hypothetical protein
MNKHHHHVEVEKSHNLALEPLESFEPQDSVTPHEQLVEEGLKAAVEAEPVVDGFNFTLNIPVVVPTFETVLATPIGEPFVNNLIDSGYMTREEAVAYLTFAAMTAQIPLMVDPFLNMYRKHKVQ